MSRDDDYPFGTEQVTRPLITCLADVSAEAVTWLWPGRIPKGKLTLIVGDPGVGKSTVTADIAARTSRGTSWPDGTGCDDGPVLWLSAEDGLADTVRPRIDRQQGAPGRIHVLRAVHNAGIEVPFTLEHD